VHQYGASVVAVSVVVNQQCIVVPPAAWPKTSAPEAQDQAEIAQASRAMLTAAEAAMHSTACNLLKLNCLLLPGNARAVEPVESLMLCGQERWKGLTLPELLDTGQ
jgi:hypothetical protein